MADRFHGSAYPRAAVVGNPSDGYGGKTIAFVFRNFKAEVEVSSYNRLKITSEERGTIEYKNLQELKDDVSNEGYINGHELITALLLRLSSFLTAQGLSFQDTLEIRYRSSIPRQVGLAGSSAILSAGLRALLSMHSVQMAPSPFSDFVWRVETENLGIAAGLQDRVAQAYENPVYMDFNRKQMEKNGRGSYEPFSLALFPSFYIAYLTDPSESSGVLHHDLKKRFESGDQVVLNAMATLSDLTDSAYQCLQNGLSDQLGRMMNLNFDIRHSICSIAHDHLEMIRQARSVGASAKFTGSGGAIIGTYENETMYQNLSEVLRREQIEILKPEIVHS